MTTRERTLIYVCLFLFIVTSVASLVWAWQVKAPVHVTFSLAFALLVAVYQVFRG